MLRASAQHILLTPLLGGSDANGVSLAPKCSLLQIDTTKLLIDCGGTPDWWARVADAVAPHADTIDAVLVTSSEIQSCGSLSVVMGLLRPDVIVYFTLPTARFGLVNCVAQLRARYGNADAVMASLGRAEPRPAAPMNATIESIYDAFRRRSCELQFDQSQNVATRDGSTDDAIAVCPVPCGRVLGACGWRIRHHDDDILYLPTFATEDSPVLTAAFAPPSGVNVLVCDAGVPAAPLPGPSEWDQLARLVLSTMRRGGAAVLPLNLSGLGLEVAVRVADKILEEGAVYKVLLVGPSARLDVARFGDVGEYSKLQDPLKTYECVETIAELREYTGGRCIILNTVDLSDNLSGAVLEAVLGDASSSILLTETPSHALAPQTARLLDAARAQLHSFGLHYGERTQLEGEDLERYRESEQREEQQRVEAELQQAEVEAAVLVEEETEEPAVSTSAAAPELPGLFIAHGVTVGRMPHRGFLAFPADIIVEGSRIRGAPGSEAATYGQPMPERLLRQLHRVVAHTETGVPTSVLRRSAQAEDELPGFVRDVRVEMPLRARVELVDVTRKANMELVRDVLRQYGGARKIAVLNAGGAVDFNSLVAGRDVFNVAVGFHADLATPTFAYAVELHPQVANLTAAGPRLETASGTWHLSSINAGLRRHRDADSDAAGIKSSGPVSLWPMDEKPRTFREHAVSGSSVGGTFVGDVQLENARSIIEEEVSVASSWQIRHESHSVAPLLVVDAAIAIRGGKELAMESIPTPNMFAVRRAFFSSFSSQI